jgi:hypothetical protein
MTGDISFEWGHILYEFVKFKYISSIYIQILREFKILIGGLDPHSALPRSAHVLETSNSDCREYCIVLLTLLTEYRKHAVLTMGKQLQSYPLLVSC